MRKSIGTNMMALGLAAAALLSLTACGARADDPAVDPVAGVSLSPDGAPTQSDDQQPPESPVQTTPVPEATPEPDPVIAGRIAEGEPVEEDWFADAVFLGDSRTDGLRLYSGLKSPAFISYKGLSVFTIDEKACIELNGKTVTVLDALAQTQYAKVYLMLGVNELGYPSVQKFKDAYLALVDEIKIIQPDATIYLQTIIPVNEVVGKTKKMSDYITNQRIITFNQAIEEVAEEKGTALVDVAEQFWDENGALPADDTSDGVHLSRQGYVAWFEYLKSHTGDTEPVEGGQTLGPDEPSGDATPLPSDGGTGE